MGGARRAVVIGINDYENKKIEPLSGAVNDATEVRDILAERGHFIIDDKHFLTDKKATGENIRAAISDLFWKTEECDVALFYFSGHGRRDHLAHGYLLPHDVDDTAPFVKGIRIQELKELFLRGQPKKTSIMILDCCYSGIATQIEKGKPDDTDHINSFRNELSLEGRGSGRFIWASAGPNRTSREEEREHAFGEGKHMHGLFSFHLIEALRGVGAGKDEFGRVSLGALVMHLENAFKDYPEHMPQLNAAAASGVYDVFLTTVAHELEASLRKNLDSVDVLLDVNSPKAVMAAINLLNELENRGLGSTRMDELWDRAGKIINESKPHVYKWWLDKSLTIFQRLTIDAARSQPPRKPEVAPSPWYSVLDNVLPNFDLCIIRQLDEMKMSFICRVMEIISENLDVQSIVNEIRMLDRDSRDVLPLAADSRKLVGGVVGAVKVLPPAEPS
jgi:uncharacterized caspase-like protein